MKRYLMFLIIISVLAFVLSGCFLLPKIAPVAPQLVSPQNGATNVSTSVKLIWKGTQSTYEVFLGTSQNPPYVATTQSTSYSASLNYSTTYYWKIANIVNGQSATSVVWSFTTRGYPKPATPILNVTSVSTNSVSLKWQTAYASAIFLYGATSTNFSQYAILSGSSTSYVVKNLTPSTQYEFFIVASNASGRATSNTVKATTLSYTPPVVPVLPVIKSFGITSVSTNTITLGFQTRNASVIYIYNPPSKLLLATASGNATSYTAINLKPSTQYSYFIVAINPSGKATSNTISATTATYIPPTSTYSVYITDKPVSPAQIQHLYVNISGVSVHVASASTSTWYTSQSAGTYDLTTLVGTSVKLTDFSLPSTGIITQIRFNISEATIVINNISYPLMIPSQTVYVNMQFINAFESNGTYLDFDLANSVEQTGQGYIFKPVIHPVNGNVRASVMGMVLSNSQPVSMVTVSLSNSSTVVAQTYTKPNGNFTIAAVQVGNYTLTINASGLSLYSTSVSLSRGMNNLGTINLSIAPSTPTLTVSSSNTYSATLRWSESIPVSAFKIWRTSNPMQAYLLVATISGTQNTYTDIVEPGHTYYYMVSAVNLSGEKFSNTTSIFVGKNYFTMPTANALTTVYTVPSTQSQSQVQSVQSFGSKSLIDVAKSVKITSAQAQFIPVKEILQYQSSQNYYNLNLSYAFAGYPNSNLVLSFINQNGAIYLQNFAPNPVLVLDSVYGNYPTQVATNAVVLLSSGATAISYNYSRCSTYIQSSTIGGHTYTNVLLVSLSGGGYTINLYFAQGYGLVNFSMNQNSNQLFQFTVTSTQTSISPSYPQVPVISYPSNNSTVPSTFTLNFSASPATYTVYVNSQVATVTKSTSVKIGPLTNGNYMIAIKSTNIYALESLSPAVNFYVVGGWIATPTYVIGTFTNWATNSKYEMTYDPVSRTYSLSTTLPSSPSVYGVNEYMIAQSYMGKLTKYGYQPIPVSSGAVTFYFNPSMAKPFTSLGIGDSSKSSQNWYFAGDMSNWQFVQMVGNSGIFTATLTTSKILLPGTYGFKITPQSTFSTSPSNLLPYYFNGSYSAYFLANGILTLATAANTFTIQFNTTNSQVKMTSATITTLPCYVAGSFNNWSTNDPSYKMSYSATSGLYYLTTTLPSTGSYKIVYNGNWYGGPYNVNIPVNSKNVTFYFNPSIASTNVAIGVGDTSKESMTWYYRGDLNGWNATQMQYIGNGTFASTLTGSFNSGSYGFKIAPNTSWSSSPFYFNGTVWGDTSSIGNGSLNLTISASTVVVYFDVLDSSVWVTPVGGANIGYYVVGSFNGWSPQPSYKMTQTSTGLYYLTTTLTSSGEYKVIYYATSTVYYGGLGSNNDYGNLPVKSGSVTFYFNPSIASTNSALGVGDTTKETMNWYFASDINNWQFATMTYIGNGTFAATITRPSTNDFAGGYGYKILPLKTWSPPATFTQYYFNGSYGGLNGGNGTIIVPQATTVVVYFNVLNSSVEAKAVNVPVTNQVIMAFLDSLNQINATLNKPVDTSNLSQFSFKVNGQNVPIASVVDANTNQPGLSNYITVNLAMPLGPSAVASPMILSINGFAPATVYARYVLNNPAFYYSGQLGAIYTPYQTTFRVWSPVSDHVNLLLYSNYDSTTPYATYAMSRNSQGVWSVSVAGNLNGIYYAYQYHRYDQWVTAPDIYSYAANAANTLSEVVDLSQTNPNGWSSDQAPFPANMTNAIIYEVHVQDFTDNPNSGVSPQYQGTYLGFTQRGTTYDGIPTGLDHLAWLGVNYVQLLPIEDYEDPQNPGYNWGYVPYLYMVPEAKYSTTPNYPINTINEVKQMIMALHSVGIGVVLDISFSHTSYVTTPYTAAVPYYYYNYNQYGQMTNYSGVGNDLKTGNDMVAKLIIDTLKYWMTQYHVSGFRFDQLYLYNPSTIQQIITNLTAINPEVLLYGEPWPAAGAQFVYGDQRGMHMGMFNGYFRDAITGTAGDYSAQGFIDGQPSQNQAEIMEGIVGSITYGNFQNDFASEPDETINYATSHDNYTLWDKIIGAEPSWNQSQDIAAQKLGLAIPLLSEGVFFMQGGDEIARTKGGNGNSYNVQLPNEFDWSRLTTFATVDNYVQGLIAIRKSHPAFTINSAQAIRDNLSFLNVPSGVVGYTINGAALGDSWATILVYFNGNTTSQTITLPSGTWNLVVDPFVASPQPIGTVSGTYTLDPLSAYVMYQ